MPGFNATEPLGRGPRTGRGSGRCGGEMNRGNSGNGYSRSWFGRTFDRCRRRRGKGGRGSGSGRGFLGNGHWFGGRATSGQGNW